MPELDSPGDMNERGDRFAPGTGTKQANDWAG